MGSADLHIHTIHSPDGIAGVAAVLKHVADKTDLDVIAITDHDSVRGVSEALDLAPAYGIEVIPGCEISTAEGHLLALYIDRPVKAGRPLIETVLRVGELGGLCIAPHPLARICSSLSIEAIAQALQHSDVARTLVGVEVFNGGLAFSRRNRDAAARARELPLAQVGSSDSHLLRSIGQGSTRFAGTSAAELRAALQAAATVAVEGRRLDGFALLRSWFPGYLLRRLGWAPWNASPAAPIQYARVHRLLAHGQPSPAR